MLPTKLINTTLMKLGALIYWTKAILVKKNKVDT